MIETVSARLYLISFLVNILNLNQPDKFFSNNYVDKEGDIDDVHIFHLSGGS